MVKKLKARTLVKASLAVSLLLGACSSGAPAAVQPASLFMSCFLLEEPESFDLDALLSAWPEKLDKRDTSLLMQVRSFIGLAFFRELVDASASPSEEDVDLLNRYTASVRFIEENLLQTHWWRE